jgi:hypothetical protein
MDLLLYNSIEYLWVQIIFKKKKIIRLHSDSNQCTFVSEEYYHYALTRSATSGCDKQPPFRNTLYVSRASKPHASGN